MNLSFLRKKKKRVVTRIAPSPTGRFHVGTARSALFNYLYAKKYNGSFILRIEDTDKERSKKEYEKEIIDSLDWLGLSYDTLYRQSERAALYGKYIQQLLESRKAYVSREEKKDGSGEVEVVRLVNSGKIITFQDEVRGEIRFDTTELGDFVIARSITDALYHLAVVIDDFEMGITHVIRGEDHISNTPRQILIQEALNFPRPIYAHIPLILAPDRSKLSKRHEKPGIFTSLLAYRDAGYLPGAVLNYLAFLGWNPGTDQEIFSLEELIATFSLEQVQKGGAIFNSDKLSWFNREYIRAMAPETFFTFVEDILPPLFFSNREMLKKIVPLIQERAETKADVAKSILAGDFDYFFVDPMYKEEQLLWKGKGDFKDTERRLTTTLERLQDVSPFTKETVKESLWDYAEKEGRGEVLWPLRVALSGKEKSPDPFELAEILGKRTTLERIKKALAIIK